MRIQAYGRDEYLLVALNRVIATDGVVGLHVRRVAAELNMAPSTLLHHYGTRDAFIERGAREMTYARRGWLSTRAFLHGPTGFLPDDDDSLVAVRAWVGWLELWRSTPALEPVFREARDDELALLADCLGHRLGREELRLLQALVDGLYDALAEPVRPLRRRTAVEILAAQVRRLGAVDPDWIAVA
jgi:AcrR family transcriptional regulator